MSSGLSDVLHQMAQGNTPGRHDEADPIEHDVEDAEAVPAKAAFADDDDLQDNTDAGFEPASVAAAPVRRPTPRRKNQNNSFKAVMVPIVATVGILLLLPAVWGTMVVLGQNVWRSDRPDAATMGKAMLICWPLSLALIGLAVIMYLQVRAAESDTPPR